jgi:hypothetical protein
MAQQTNRKAARVLLAAGAPLVVAVLGVSLGVAGGSARADNGQPIILGGLCNPSVGGTNCETSPTSVVNTATDNSTTLRVEKAGFNTSSSALAVEGTGIAISAISNGDAFHGMSGGSGGASGVYGENDGNGNGVYGHASNSSASGVYGQNGGTGFGVAGRAAGGVGVLGDSANGTGVWASSQNATALRVSGKAQFSRSGVATVAGTSSAPKKSVKVSLPITGKSMMTALLQKFVAGVYVVAAVPNVTGGYFTIYLNKAVSTSVGPIAWMVTEKP